MPFAPFNPEIIIGPRVNPEDLANGFYTQLSHNPAKVNERLRSILRWFSKHVQRLPSFVDLVAQGQQGDITKESDATPVLPTVMVWGAGTDKEFRHDASLVYFFPETALVDLKQSFGGDASVLVWYTDEPSEDTGATPIPSPVGDRWPEKDTMVGGEAYRPRVTPDVNPVGGIFPGPAGGTYKKVIKSVGFVQFPVYVKQIA